MATALVKGAVAVGALATASGVGTAIYFNTGTTIADKLAGTALKLISNKEDYKFILFDNKAKQEFKDAIGKKTVDHNDSTHIDALDNWCKEKLKAWASSDKDNSIYEKVKAWCVEPTKRTLRQKLKGALHRDTEWQGKYTGFAGDTSKGTKFLDALKNAFPRVTLEKTTAEGGAKLKEWCVGTLELRIYEVTDHKSEENIQTWCLDASR
ncbi:hypothetical protein A6V39_03265 [Candidatus Mycoplasma haematobovis]|uniref:Uncharacterized protein n=1 Tax=Candidatus Mycoplasma haematobovis TaxID=432608 RepID=A0A1A9QCT4_9MOLU|nr:hypothetical protein [Candidatus Mycoplasma haematobovis]OAL09904.1 hypothetical protein A6V39_03265 [Candidatus Mycoplasma haematobovis]